MRSSFNLVAVIAFDDGIATFGLRAMAMSVKNDFVTAKNDGSFLLLFRSLKDAVSFIRNWGSFLTFKSWAFDDDRGTVSVLGSKTLSACNVMAARLTELSMIISEN